MTTLQTVTRARKTTKALQQLTIPKLDPTRLTFKVADLNEDIAIKVPKSDAMAADFSLQLLVNGAEYGDELYLGDEDFENATEFDLVFKKEDIPADGTDTYITFDYWVFDPIAGDGTVAQLPLRARFDRLAPGGDNPPVITFTADQLSGITDDDLVDDTLTAHISNYLGAEVDDVLQLWMGTSATEGNLLTPTFTVTIPAMPTAVTISRTDLASIADGLRYFGYQITDWAGNVSEQSELVQINVFLDLPAALTAPVVPANADGLVTYPDAIDGVDVQIPSYNGAKAGDVLTLHWGIWTMAGYTISAEEAAANPIVTLVVPYHNVASVGNGTDIAVNFTLTRGGANRDSPNALVDVNLDMPGGPDPDPDPGTPEHENVLPPTLTCGVSPSNTILPPDYGLEASVTITRLSKKNQPIWEVGDKVQLTYGTKTTPDIAPVTITTDNEAADLDITLPFETIIKLEGVGTIPVFFTITRTLSSASGDVEVDIHSPTQNVKVASDEQLPGGGTLLPGVFPEAISASGTEIIQRAAGIDGTTFQIPLNGVSNIGADRASSITWFFYGVSNGTDRPLPGGHDVIEGTVLSRLHIPITQQMLVAGYYDFPLTYEYLRKICRNGARLGYLIQNDVGTSNAPQKYVYFALNVAAGGCPITPVR